MRRSLSALLAVLALVFVSACGASGGDDDAAEETTTTTIADDTTEDTAAEDEGDDDDETTTTESDDEPSGGGVEVEAWADDFCGSFETWLDEVQAASSGVTDSITPGDMEGAKTAIINLFGTVATHTETLIGEIESAGAPDIDDGDDFLADLIVKFEDFHAAIETARAQAETVSTTDPVAFESEFTALLATFQSETETVGNSFSELDAKYSDRDLNAAVESACSFL